MEHLTKKQEDFCIAFVKSGDKSAAYREAYNCSNMKNQTIHVKANELFNVGKVSVRIKELQKTMQKIAEEKFNINSEEILKHLNILRKSRIDEYVNLENNKLAFKDFSKLTDEQLMCIESIKQNRYGDIEIKLHGKEWSIEKINKHIGFYAKDNEQQKSNLSIIWNEEKTYEIKE